MANVSLPVPGAGAENNCVMQNVACDCEAYTVCPEQQHTQKRQTDSIGQALRSHFLLKIHLEKRQLCSAFMSKIQKSSLLACKLWNLLLLSFSFNTCGRQHYEEPIHKPRWITA